MKVEYRACWVEEAGGRSGGGSLGGSDGVYGVEVWV